MLGWSHKFKFGIVLASKLLAVLAYIVSIATIIDGGTLSWPLLIFIGLVLLLDLLATARRGHA